MTPFRTPDRFIGSLTTDMAASLLAESNDICLVIDRDNVIRDVAIGTDEPTLKVSLDWIGEPLPDTVTIETRPKIKLLKDDLKNPDKARWRQLNHSIEGQPDLPVLYKALRGSDSDHIVLIGRDLRPMAQLQQKLLDVQHSLERDYTRLHQAETRYRMLFSMANEAILIVDAESRRIVEANPAAGKMLDRPAGKLVNRTFPRGFSDNSVDSINDLLVRVRAAGRAESIIVRSANDQRTFQLTATLVRREDGHFFLIRIQAPGDSSADSTNLKVLEVVDRSPDAFVVTDPDGRVLAANRAFLDLTQVAAELQVKNQNLDQWLGRPGVDLNLLLRNLRERLEVRQFTTTLRPEYGDPVDVELSAVSALDSDEPCFGFIIRRQFRAAPQGAAGTGALPRTIEEMTNLVGQVPLKDLVRETTDIIERMCIEAALKMTDDSRASAAEILGLSRQSLYVKLRRYGLGDLGGD
jgi:transcriptional regulator PpsR